MYFATASARTTALSGVTVEGMVTYIPANGIEYYNGSVWVSISAAVTALTTKGDLLTYSTQDTRLPVGADGTTLVANSASATGISWAGPTFAAGKNKIINGDFGVWQRGTSFNYTGLTATTYTADRFSIFVNGNGTYTVSQQTFTPGSAPVVGYESQFFCRFATNTVGTSTAGYIFTQRIEDVRQFAGQTVTLSFYAKADSARTIFGVLEQNFGSGGSTTVVTSFSTNTLSTSWTRYSVSVAVPSISGKTIGSSSFLQLAFQITPAASQVLDIWGVQLEAGSVATPFTTATGTVQGELAACQRYYYPWSAFSIGITVRQASTTQHYANCSLPVSMRTSPTIAIGNATGASIFSAASSTATLTLTANGSNYNYFGLSITTTAIGATGYAADFSSGTATISASAEL